MVMRIATEFSRLTALTAVILAGAVLTASPQAHAAYDVPITTPNCSNPGADVKIIKSTTDWKDINSSSYRSFCVMPGDYTSLGKITITADGTSSSPRKIVYYRANDTGDMPWQQSDANRAKVKSLSFVGANWWVIHRITVTDAGYNSGSNYLLSIGDNSDNNVVDSVLVEKAPASLGYVGKGSDGNTIQKSVFRKTKIGTTEAHCLFVNAGSIGDVSSLQNVHNLRVVANEFYDCAGDAIQLWTENKDAPTGDLAGLVVDNNDFYVTPAMYTDCNGNLDNGSSGGYCSCSENAIDIKVGVKSSTPASADVIKLTNNRIWGYRRGDGTAGGACPNLHSWGNALTFHKVESDFANVAQNLIFNTSNGIVANGGADNVNITDNVFYQVAENRSGDPRTGTSRGAFELGGTKGIVQRNIVVEGDIYLAAGGGAVFNVSENHFINGGVWKKLSGGDFSSTSKVGGNYYYSTKPYDGVADVKNNTISSVSDGIANAYCTQIKRLTNPTNQCIPNAGISQIVGIAPPAAPSGLSLTVGP